MGFNLFIFQTETALVYDAVQVFAKALTDLDRSQDVQPVSIDCTGRETWQHGNSLVNYMKMVSYCCCMWCKVMRVSCDTFNNSKGLTKLTYRWSPTYAVFTTTDPTTVIFQVPKSSQGEPSVTRALVGLIYQEVG